MTSFYDYIADGKVASIEALENYAEQLRNNQCLLVTGAFACELYNGDDFCWLSSQLQLFSWRPDPQDVYLAIRTDFMNRDEIESRFERDDSSLKFDITQRFSYDHAKFVVLKSRKPISGYAEIKFKVVKESGGAGRELSIPLTRLLLVPQESGLTNQEVVFSLRTGLAKKECSAFPSTGYQDKVAEYFRAISLEMVNGA